MMNYNQEINCEERKAKIKLQEQRELLHQEELIQQRLDEDCQAKLVIQQQQQQQQQYI
jgi:hypothetical protein